METSKPSNKPMPFSGKLLKFLEQENKPFTLNTIHERMGKDINKKTIQSNIEILVAQGQIIEKTVGKLKVYCVNNKNNKIIGEAVRILLSKLFQILVFQFSTFQ